MPVVIITQKDEFRNLGKIDTGSLLIHIVHSRDEVVELIHKYREFCHLTWGGLKNWDSTLNVEYAIDELIISQIPFIVLFQEQFPCNGIKGLLRRLKWFYLLRISKFRKIPIIGFCGKPAIKAYSFYPTNKSFEFIYTPFKREKFPSFD